MNDLEQKIIEIMQFHPYEDRSFIGILCITQFISKCSLSDFEKLKDMEWELSQKTDHD